MIPIPGGWIIARKQELIALSKTRYQEGRKNGIGETNELIQSSKELMENSNKIELENEQLKTELLNLHKLIDQTQKDAYELGYSNGSKGTRDEDIFDEEERIE